MILLFPDSQTLRLAVTTGLLPESVTAAAAEFTSDDNGRIWVKSDEELSKEDRQALKALGISFRKSTRGSTADIQSASCWPEILPLEKITEASSPLTEIGERTPVLFELPESANLAEVVSELLRLGNDRQSFRQHKTPDGTRTLLMVKGPPYYTLLRALDELDGSASLRAYVEHQPRVWVEYGYKHPLGDCLQPQAGTFLLLAKPRTWQTIEEGKFHDIYEALKFTIPGKPLAWEAGELAERLKVRLKLVRGGSDDPAELWVLSETGQAQLEELVRSSDDRLISRLAFAVGTSPDDDNQRVLVVKVRPGKEPPPVLVLDGISCRSYLRIPNLFLPVGHRLHPPLRRDAVKKLLAADANLDNWLLPQADGQFLPQSLPDNAFRPLTDWVDYVLDTNREALKTWAESMQFDFESFICPDDAPDRSPPARQNRREPKPTERTSSNQAAGTSKKTLGPANAKTKSVAAPDKPKAISITKRAALQPNEMLLKLQALEKQFRELPEPLDSPARQDLWRELAELNMALNQKSDGAVCYVNGLWDQREFASDWIEDWYAAEVADPDAPPLTGQEFSAVLSAERPTPLQLNVMAVHVIRAAFGPEAAADSHGLPIAAIQQLLERYENYLPLKITWLAWLACVKLSHDDFLTLARTRDRVLERLHQQGPSPELDLPGFLRSTGPRMGDRFRAVQDTMRTLPEKVHQWIDRELQDRPPSGRGQTSAYADLMIAFGYSRVGMAQECHELLERTSDRLLSDKVQNPVHTWLLEAFRFRILQSLEGKSRTASLPEDLMKPLTEKTLDSGLVYIIESLRSKSRILQPFEQVNSYTRFLLTRNHASLAAEVEQLSDIDNRVALAARIRELLEQHGGQRSLDESQATPGRVPVGSTSQQSPSHRVLLSAVLPFAPRLGDAFATELLEDVPATLEQLNHPGQRAVLLDKALFAAAHFGQAIRVRQCVEQLQQLFQTASGPETAGVFGSLLGQSFRGLRKLGMRGEISSLLEQIDQLIYEQRFEGETPAGKSKKPKTVKPNKAAEDKALAMQMDAMTLRLNLAAGWFYFGNDERAEVIIEEVSRFLFEQHSLGHRLRRAFARQYTSVLEHAPMEVAIPRLTEMFDRLTKIDKGLGRGQSDDYYAYEPLEVVEPIILALVNDDMMLDPKARRLMDELEFSIRNRIHKDMQLARQHSGM